MRQVHWIRNAGHWLEAHKVLALRRSCRAVAIGRPRTGARRKHHDRVVFRSKRYFELLRFPFDLHYRPAVRIAHQAAKYVVEVVLSERNSIWVREHLLNKRGFAGRNLIAVQ
jgi:hypothetical protein